MVTASYDVDRARELSNKVAVVGVGDTDYGKDFAEARAAEKRGEALAAEDAREYEYKLLITAFKRALADCGLTKDDINGLAVSSSGTSTAFERVGEMLGLTVSWGAETGNSDHLVQIATEALVAGRCDTIAIVHGNSRRSSHSAAYGGANASGYMNLWYYHPWGFSSSGAQYALAFRQYCNRFGKSEDDLAPVAVAFRKHAILNENAALRKPLTIEDYRAGQYICEPFRIFDYCMINDGGACLILRRADMSRDLPHTPVLVAGLGRYSPYYKHSQIPFRMLEGCWENLGQSSGQCFAMAGMGPSDVDLFQCYDGYSFHLPMNLEGFGFCKQGEGLDFIKDGRIELGGELPCNTSGGMLSEAYMHGINHQVEAVRQLRHEAGRRQVNGAETAMYCHHGHWGALSVMYQRDPRA